MNVGSFNRWGLGGAVLIAVSVIPLAVGCSPKETARSEAPTRYIYPAKIKKAQLERILLENGGKTGEDTVKIDGKGMKCRTLTGTIKEPGGEQIEFKLWLSDDVPGTIVKQVRSARQKDELIAETTTILQSFKKAD